MTRWREAASAETQDDLDRLVSLALERAGQQLRNGSRLVPFAAAVLDDGSAAVLTDRVAASGSARQDLELLYVAAARHRERHRAVAFAAPITLDGVSAVRIEAEHRSGVAIAVRVPYRVRFLGGVRFGTMQLGEGPVRFWR